jgi:hypothetical protein
MNLAKKLELKQLEGGLYSGLNIPTNALPNQHWAMGQTWVAISVARHVLLSLHGAQAAPLLRDLDGELPSKVQQHTRSRTIQEILKT